VREAILNELERGGKAFYVHHRVASIEARRRYLEDLVPEARIGVVHGQMPEGLIEETMMLFAEGAYDVLLATTIIEAGLDVPEAGTILIERADLLGLATLYQLRGRVGRRDQEAYAYLFHPPRLTEAAEKRLHAIADLSDLGSGHLLAEKDMEIRGVGNLLGPEQHGHIRALSLEVYTELLEEALRKLKGERVEARPHVTLDLALSARLPAEYVGSLEARSRYYSRFAEAKTLAEVSRLVRELKERYGPLPRRRRTSSTSPGSAWWPRGRGRFPSPRTSPTWWWFSPATPWTTTPGPSRPCPTAWRSPSTPRASAFPKRA
jgi:transcription-repair coupling factor (superfamily II helicase)